MQGVRNSIIKERRKMKRPLTDQDYHKIKEEIFRLPNHSVFTRATKILLDPVRPEDKDSIDFAHQLKIRLTEEGYTKVAIRPSFYSGNYPKIAYEVTEGFPPEGSPYIIIYPID